IGVRGLAPVALDVRADDASAREIWVGSGSCGASLYPSGSPVGAGVAFAAVVVVDGDSTRTLADLADAGTAARRELIGGRRRVRWAAPDGLEIEGFLT